MKTLHITDFRPNLYRSTSTVPDGPPQKVKGKEEPEQRAKEIENTVPRELTSLPSGCEEHITLKEAVGGQDILITARIQDSADIMRLLLATDACRRSGAHSVSAFIPYLPYARMDRIAGIGEPLSLKVMADLLNAQKYRMVITIDAHSETASALIDHCINLRYFEHLRRALVDFPDARICAPHGAHERVEAMALQVAHDKPILFSDIRRNLKGEDRLIVEDVSGTVIVVNDICEDGQEFIELAELLRERGANKVVLCVTHGLFTKGIKNLKKVYDGIYTTDSYVIAKKKQPEVIRLEL